MIIDFTVAQCQRFHAIAQRIKEAPDIYLNFEDIADFYQAKFLDEFPQGTSITVLGLDDGAEYFDVVICYQHCFIKISKTEHIRICTSLDAM